jgi:hypothetical protein
MRSSGILYTWTGLGKSVHTGTYQYVPVQHSTRLYENLTIVRTGMYRYIPVCTLKKTSCFLTHPERFRRDKIKPAHLLCMGYNVAQSNFKTSQVYSMHGTYQYILVHTGTDWYRRKPNSTLHWITLGPPSCAYESQQNDRLGPFAQLPCARLSPSLSDHPGVAFHGQSSIAKC